MVQVRRTENSKLILKLNQHIFPSDPLYINASSLFWVVKLDQLPVGFATAKGLKYEPTVAYLDRAGLKPIAQGMGLHKHLIKVRLRYLKKLGYKSVITYTLDNNLASANNLTACGFKLYQPDYRWADSDKKKEVLYFMLDL